MPQNLEGVSDEMKLQALKEAEEKERAKKADILDERKRARDGIRPGRKRPQNHVAQGLPSEVVKQLLPYYEDIGPKPLIFFSPKRWKWYFKRHKERIKLRRDLRKNYGIKNRAEFERIARELGLGIDNPVLAFFFWLFGILFSSAGLISVASGAALLLLALMAYSNIVETAGSFTVQVNPSTFSSGFHLSTNMENPENMGRLNSEELENVNAMTIDDIPKDIDSNEESRGKHNGEDYVAYTFYLTNNSEEEGAYEYAVYIDEYMKGVDKAIWVMVFEDGEQVVYAEAKADGSPEVIAGYDEQNGYSRAPFKDDVYGPNASYQYYQFENAKGATKWAVRTTPFAIVPEDGQSQITVCLGRQDKVQPGESHKYTVVVWLEGYDKQCSDDLFGGFAKLSMEFTPLNEERFDLFKNVYRLPVDPDDGTSPDIK